MARAVIVAYRLCHSHLLTLTEVTLESHIIPTSRLSAKEDSREGNAKRVHATMAVTANVLFLPTILTSSTQGVRDCEEDRVLPEM